MSNFITYSNIKLTIIFWTIKCNKDTLNIFICLNTNYADFCGQIIFDINEKQSCCFYTERNFYKVLVNTGKNSDISLLVYMSVVYQSIIKKHERTLSFGIFFLGILPTLKIKNK